MYVGIQLFEPYKELHYIARKLKDHQLISNYRLDERNSAEEIPNCEVRDPEFTALDLPHTPRSDSALAEQSIPIPTLPG